MSPKLLLPSTVAEATAMLARHKGEAKAFSGGTAMVSLMQDRLLEPSYLVTLYKIPGLDYVRHESESITERLELSLEIVQRLKPSRWVWVPND
jgi:CO/xanthine dehydrogenase FAD-binding subunit